MGWTGSYEWTSATAVHAELLDQLTRSGFTVLGKAATSYGRNFYVAIEKPDVPATMFVAIVSGGRATGRRGDDIMWGYKDMDESMGPYEYDCPLALLDKLGPPPNEWAANWREKVRAFHARRAAGADIVKTAKKGDKVFTTARPEPYTVAYRQKNSLIGYRHDGAGPYRLLTKTIVRLEAI
jgi:hypothetical protein